MSVNIRIRNYIKDKGLTFTFVANKAGIDVKRFSRLMTGKQVMRMDEFENICLKGLDVNPKIFFAKEFSKIEKVKEAI